MPLIIDSDTLCNTCQYGLTHVERGLYKKPKTEPWQEDEIFAKYVMISLCTHPTITGTDGVPWKWADACVSCPLYSKKSGMPYCPTTTEEVEGR